MFCAAALSLSAGCSTAQLGTDHSAGTAIMCVMELMGRSWPGAAGSGSLTELSLNHSPRSPATAVTPS